MEYFTVFRPDGTSWVGSGIDGTVAAYSPPEGYLAFPCTEAQFNAGGMEIGDVRTLLAGQIDAAAEQARCHFITPGSGQAMTYLRKEQEARAFVADNAAETPFLTAEATATGVTVAALAQIVIAKADAWTVVGPKIEAARLAAKKALVDGVDIAAVHAAAQVDWQQVIEVQP